MNNYTTISQDITKELIVKRSRFVCSASSITTSEEGMSFLKERKKIYSDATHNCYAMIGLPLDNFEKSSDDGEPSGTAGIPIKNMINCLGLEGIICVVSRYFGGVKLGASGLTSAYAESVANCLKEASLVEKIWADFYTLTLDYSEAMEIQKLLSLRNDVSLHFDYADKVIAKVGIPVSKFSLVRGLIESITRGKVDIIYFNSSYISQNINSE